jgi:hypothetical protein
VIMVPKWWGHMSAHTGLLRHVTARNQAPFCTSKQLPSTGSTCITPLRSEIQQLMLRLLAASAAEASSFGQVGQLTNRR